MYRIVLAASAALAFAHPAAAQEACAVDGDAYDLDDAGVAALYTCMSERMVEGYTREGDDRASAYREWTQASTRMAVAGPHGERFLNTFVNDAASAQYLRFEEGAFEMPVGSVLAKESVAVRDGTGRVGPLFLMTKVADAPNYGGWFYEGVQPNGKPMKISQSFCHDCHSAFDASDSMGYPLEEVRASAE
ncbi:MAG: cytochrome P460 family protein [Jannaschia sp.]